MPPAPEGPTSRLRGLAGRADVALILTTLGAAALRFWRIGNASLWYDEWVTADDVHHRLAEMVISVLPYSEGSPPLYFVLQWLWLPIAGRDEAALRSLAALIGVATVPMMYALVRELGQSRRAARIAALIVATNPLLVWYSREARPYSLLALTATISLFFCVRAVRRGGPRDFLWWGLAAAAALSSHYFAAFLILPEIVWLFRTHRGRPLAWGCLPLAVVSVPLAVLALRQQGVNQAWIADFPLGLRLGELGRHLVLGPAEPFDAWWPVAVVLAVVVAIVLVRRGEPGEGRSAAIMVGVGASGLLLAARVAPHDRDHQERDGEEVEHRDLVGRHATHGRHVVDVPVHDHDTGAGVGRGVGRNELGGRRVQRRDDGGRVVAEQPEADQDHADHDPVASPGESHQAAPSGHLAPSYLLRNSCSRVGGSLTRESRPAAPIATIAASRLSGSTEKRTWLPSRVRPVTPGMVS
ncbi:MAG: glycosyltransferase family 39 protein, partial [Acidimicrobiia bacterium]